MSVKIKDKITSDGKKLERLLKELAEKQVRVGFQHGKATEEDGTDICDIAAWNELGTVNMPSRPFLRMSVDENEAKIKAFLRSQKKNILSGASGEQVLAKGSSKPLIDTGRMRQSVNYVIQQKGSGD